ncbi:hypothetical protein CLAFUW4_08625 [Fulvia fulva]|uniref:Myb-like domain-containing protein n=1 Tax=Passalora fulva TaxID=5499 RepID=A0A9Q8LE27_PASFU|nr:uncharacterized protein CLAFUR5_08726 [Fulvia fulva]KAK4629962.1 hypothetical protein CLAFUR0_08623 [Fulvia fulva]UJO15519.1 hypothetical protein CLAFUR5_08726 [Fulvia fulva]WPV13080.1 hypothetical protein CLAFUW4_08625 [Fulvia fulva]
MKIPCFDSRIHMALVRRSDETGMSVERTLSEINNERRRRGLKPLKHGRGRQAWSDEEDRSLKHLKEVLQLPWAAIAEHFPHRTVGGISNHYFEIKNEKRTTDIPTSIEAASESTSEPPKQTSTKDVSYDEFSKVVHRRVRRLAAHLEVLRKSPITLTKAGMNYIIETLPKESKKSAQAIRAQQISQAEKAKRIVSVIDKLLIRFIAAAAGEDTKDGKEALTSMLFRKRMEEDEILFAPLNDKETK